MSERLPESLTCRVLVSPVTDPFFNLAWEEYLFRTLAPEQLLLLFYRNAPAVLIGRHQNPWRECRVTALPAAGLILARRFSGGGAVYHDPGNLNFSFIMPRRLYAPARFLTLVLDGLRHCAIDAAANPRHGLELHGRKFSGSAFMLTGARALHHGTLLLHTNLERLAWALTGDDTLDESKAVASVSSPVMNLVEAVPDLTHERLITALTAAFSAAAGQQLTAESMVPERLSTESEFIAIHERHLSDEWRFERTPPFARRFQVATAKAALDFKLRIENGKVAEVLLAPAGPPSAFGAWLARQLPGTPYEWQALRAAVNAAPPQPSWVAPQRELARLIDTVFKVSE